MNPAHAQTRLAILAVGLLSTLVSLGRPAFADPALVAVDYNRQIRPILASHCFQCHGPDDKERQAGLRFDLSSAALEPAESGQTAIVPGQPDQSELVKRIETGDASERMPPPDANKDLTAEQKALLRRWIAEGAKSETHWSLVAPTSRPIPQVTLAAWSRNAIDCFVLGRLEQERLTPSPEADRLTLVRRVYLDLIGLPPTPAEADAFAADTRPEAYALLVDRLLASPRYGERWARRWLDLARYADTNGYEKDRARSIWPYRDWVVRALNADMPFDCFTIEQLAGDLLPGAGLEQRIATGFHRNTMTNEEGGIDVEEFRFHSIVDRVSTTSAVWLALTIGCAQCHNHKFDPVSQQEYYQLFGLLNNADEPELEVPQASIAAIRAEIEREIAVAASERDAQFDAGKFADWTREAAGRSHRWFVVPPASVLSTGHATMTTLADGSVLANGDKPNQDTYVVELPLTLPRVTALRLEVLPDESLPDGGPGRAPLYSVGDFMLGEFTVELPGTSETDKPAKVAVAGATQDFASEKTSAAQAADGDLDTGWSIKGRIGQAHQAVFPLAQPLEVAPGRRLRITLEQRYIHQMTIGRFRLSVTADAEPKASGLPAEIEQALLIPADQRNVEQQSQLKSHYLSVAPEVAEPNKKIAELRANLPRHPTTLVMQERQPSQTRVTHRAHRGEFLSPREVVAPGTPAVLHPWPAGAPKNRLGLARWLVDPANPLVARVVVNRRWQAFFGRGLVRTSEDFGLRGEAPSHPELLDYLATQFVAHGWSLKELDRQIVSSSTYRQSSRAPTALIERDPDNVLLARGPRIRVEAEMVRDMALSVAGLLVPTMGGPSVHPPQPAGVTDLAYGATPWPTSSGAERFRRGLYTFSKRTSPFAAFVTFDAPSGENCTVRRERSNTPLQALTLLNDTMFLEAARGLARRACEAPGGSERARQVFRLCLVREPAPDELALVEQFYATEFARLEKDASAAKAIAADNPQGAPDTAPVTELAAWTLVGRALLNLDEFITRE